MSETQARLFGQRARPYLKYVLVSVIAVAAYFLIRAFGDTLAAPTPSIPQASGAFSSVHVNDFVHVLLALVFVIAAARTLGMLFRFVHQPAVVGEMIAGILLGPSLLGHVAPHFAAYILPPSIAPLLNVIAQVGVILYMFLVGLELDLSGLRGRAHSTIAISHASILGPFLLGTILALILYPQLSTNDVSFTAFSLFLGVSMSVTAFPVLARILTDRGIHKTKMGTIALACAAIDDVSAWCLLAFVVSVTQSRPGRALPTVLLAVAYVAGMLLIVRPLLVRLTLWIDSKGRLTQGSLAFVLLAILLSSLATESIGIHSIFGAFILGAIIPHRSSLARDIAGKLEDFVIVFLLPAFFAFTGLRTQIGLVSGARQWFFCALIIFVASVGKFGGSAIAAKLSGLSWRESSALGVLMNTRGLMELIVLNIGLELHVISPALFAMLVLMALVTTFATTPVLHFIAPRKNLEKEASRIEVAAAVNERSGILVPISNANSLENLLDLGFLLTPAEGPPLQVLALVRGPVAGLRSGLGEVKELPPSRSPLLSAALDIAWARGQQITPRAVWTSDPARDIVQAADRSCVKWLLFESRRSLFDSYAKPGFASKVLQEAASLSMHVAVLPPSAHPVEADIVCLFHASKDGIASLDLAAQLAANRKKKPRIVVLLAGEEELAAARHAWHTLRPADKQPITVTASTVEELMKSPHKDLLIAGKDVIDQMELAKVVRDRNLIIVQGAGQQVDPSAHFSLQLQPATA